MAEQKRPKSRREFLKGIGAIGVAGAGVPLIAGSARASVTEWDESHDLVIIGSGFAGLAAAIEARERGIDDVVIFEKMPPFRCVWMPDRNSIPICSSWADTAYRAPTRRR